MPQSENEFTKILGLYFPNHYDIKVLVRDKNKLRGSLNKLAQYLYVEREGKIHQAGSDSYVTNSVFWKLITYRYITNEELSNNKNILFGISEGKDDEETIKYMKISHDNNRLNLKNNNSCMNTNNFGNNINNTNYYENNNLLYMQLNINSYNFGMNYFYPQMMINQINNGFNRISGMNNANSIIQYV